MVDEAKWLEITGLTHPKNVHCPEGKIKVPEKKGGQIKERITRDGNHGSNNITEGITANTLGTRMLEMKELLEKKTRTIVRQEEIISKLNARLAHLTTESLRKSYLNDSRQLSSGDGSKSDVEENSVPDIQQSVAELMTGSRGGPEGRVLGKRRRGNPKGLEEQLKKTFNRSNNNNIDEQCEDAGENSEQARNGKRGRVRQSFLSDRLDSLERKMVNLEAELPKRIQAICAELFQRRGLPECHYKSDDSGTTSQTNASPRTCTCRSTHDQHEGSLAQMVVDASSRNMEFFSSTHKKSDPLPTIPVVLSDKCVHHSNPSDPLKWNKSPVIKPKTNLSANYRLHHASKSGEKWHKSTHDSSLIHRYPLQMIEDKLSNIEQVVQKFKQYLLTILFNKLQG